MFDQLESLIALNQAGTMAAAATRLHLTPSAVSKRIALLEAELGYKLAEPKGRKVELTPAALRLVERITPLLAEMKSVLSTESWVEAGEISLGVTESVLDSWGPAFLARIVKKTPKLKLSIHAHRSPVVVDRVRSGEYAVGICAGIGHEMAGLRSRPLTREPMVIVPAKLKTFALKKGDLLELLSIDSHALSWETLKPQLKALSELHGLHINVTQEIESFSSVVQLAKSGFGHGLAPVGIAAALGVKPEQMIKVPGELLQREISYVARASTLGRPSLKAFFETLESEARSLEHGKRP